MRSSLTTFLPRAVAAVACVVAGLVLVGPWRDEMRLHRVEQALAAGRSAAVITLGHDLGRRSVAVRSERLQMLAALQAGKVRAAERVAARAVAAAPNDWSLWLDDAVLLRRLGRTREAQRAFATATALNPRLTTPPGFAR